MKRRNFLGILGGLTAVLPATKLVNYDLEEKTELKIDHLSPITSECSGQVLTCINDAGDAEWLPINYYKSQLLNKY